SATGLKGSFSEAKVDGGATDLSAVVTGAVATGASTFRAAPVTFAPVAAGETVTLTLNGTGVTLDDTDTAATTVAKINAANTASNTGVTAALDGSGDIVMSSAATFTATAATAGVGGTAGFAAAAVVT
ncbi:flagellin, partial [Pseudomonas qingdaonensis]